MKMIDKMAAQLIQKFYKTFVEYYKSGFNGLRYRW